MNKEEKGKLDKNEETQKRDEKVTKEDWEEKKELKDKEKKEPMDEHQRALNPDNPTTGIALSAKTQNPFYSISTKRVLQTIWS